MNDKQEVTERDFFNIQITTRTLVERQLGQSRNELKMLDLFWICRNDEISFEMFAKTGNIVEATFYFVERIVRLEALDNVASTLFPVWTGLKRVMCPQAQFTINLVWMRS